MSEDLRNVPGIGVAGNFAGHLEQAGEAENFRGVKTAESTAPKAIFPFYIPGNSTFLGTFCVSPDTIRYPRRSAACRPSPRSASSTMSPGPAIRSPPLRPSASAPRTTAR